MKHIGLVVISILIGFGVFAQPQAELEKYQALYPGMQMVVLEKVEEIRIEQYRGKLFIYETTYTKNMYLTKDAGMFREREIGFSSFSSISEISATTLVPTAKKYKKNVTKEFKESDDLNSSVFHDDSKIIRFNFLGLQMGAITELRYKRKIKDPHFLGRAVLQGRFPIENQVYRVVVNADIEVEFTAYLVQQDYITYTTFKENGRTIYEWTVKNAPVIHSEKWAPAMSYYLPQVFPRVASYTYNGKTTRVLGNVKDLFTWYETFVDTVNTDTDNPLIQATVDSIVTGATTDLEKVKRVFEWTQENIKYVAYEAGLGGFVPRSAISVCTNRYGDCKDMASTITHLLKYAGIEAHLTWIGTNAIPFTYDQLPTPSVDNHMIATYISEDGTHYFMDATGRYMPFGMPSSFIQEQEALIRLGPGSFETLKVPLVAPAQNAIDDKINATLVDGVFTGSAVSSFNGYYKQNLEYKIEDQTPDEKAKFYKGYLRKGSNKFIPDGFEESHAYPDEQPFEIAYNFTIGDYAMVNGKEWYVNLNLSDFFSGDKLDPERKTPFMFKFTAKQTETVAFTIPEGFSLDYTPKPLEINNELLYFKVSYTVQDKIITLNTESYKKKIYYQASDVTLWNTSVNSIIKSQKNVVILKKTN